MAEKDLFEKLILEHQISNDAVNIILKRARYSDYTPEELITRMYKIFNLFGFSDKFIEILIIKQPIIPGLDISELRKMAYVFSRVNDIEELVVNTAKIQGFKNYKRIFIRDYLKRICKWNKNISSNMYIASENEVYGSKYKFGFIYKGKEPVYLNCDDDVITFFETYELDKSKYSNLDDYLEKVSATEMRKLMLTGGVKHD